ncbi:MAG: ATP-dependent RecD-like DNA helicase, partial [Candidatus Coatesbacteria bacterium]|nr:ATP-dependent RecD-like DNA helicase [Candidatus Coatesbacteria bacterium]
ERLMEVEGIGKKRLELIKRSFQKQKETAQIMTFLASLEIGLSGSYRILEKYKEKTVQYIKEDPYRLADEIWGFGFIKTDKVAKLLGFHENDIRRAKAALKYMLSSISQEGHTCYPKDDLIKRVETRLRIPEEVLLKAFDEELGCGTIVSDEINNTFYIYSSKLFSSEIKAVTRLHEILISDNNLPRMRIDDEIIYAQRRVSISLTEEQKHALSNSLNNKISVISGGPGVGKTTIMKVLVSILLQNKVKFLLTSPTGRAAKRLSETTSYQAKTIHRALGWDPQKATFIYNESNAMPFDFIIVDETSMIDLQLLCALVLAVPDKSHLLFIGDVDQLPSVGAGQVLRDLISWKKIGTVYLRKIFRQKSDGTIVSTAHKIKNGTIPLFNNKKEDTVFFLNEDKPERALPAIVDLVNRRLPNKYGFSASEIQVLSPQHKGIVGIESLNIALQNNLNPVKEEENFKIPYGLRIGDKIIQLRNNYDKGVFNGDMGIISDVDEEERKIFINFEERIIPYVFEELDEISLAYACSIHKSQGSEFRCVVIPLFTEHYMMLQKNLLYTAFTRAKELVVIIGQQQALEMAIKNTSTEKRYSFLSQRLNLTEFKFQS